MLINKRKYFLNSFIFLSFLFFKINEFIFEIEIYFLVIYQN